MPKGDLYVSGMSPRVEAIIRAFCAKNGLSTAELMTVVSHILCGYNTLKMFGEPIAGPYEEAYREFDNAVRDYMVKNTPSWYQSRPLLRRLFTTLCVPLTAQELREIDEDLKETE